MSFASYIEDRCEPDPNSGCWLWTSGLTTTGYGRAKNSAPARTAHRLSWVAYRGAIPEGMCVLHKCDVRCCVNPDHLFIGTQAENMADMGRKGRAPMTVKPESSIFWGSRVKRACGERVAKSKLTEVIVREIRTRLSRGEGPTSLSRLFGVTRENIYAIRNRRTWKHVVSE